MGDYCYHMLQVVPLNLFRLVLNYWPNIALAVNVECKTAGARAPVTVAAAVAVALTLRRP